MKIKKSELIKITKEVANKVIRNKILAENSDFTSIRRIKHLAEEAAINFEDVIVKELKLKHPDQLTPEAQTAYNEIVDELKTKISEVVVAAVNKLQPFPRETGPEKIQK